jgi:hypothetical protein
MLFAGAAWFGPLEAGMRDRIRALIEEFLVQELDAAPGRGRYERGGRPSIGTGTGRGGLPALLGRWRSRSPEPASRRRTATPRSGALRCCGIVTETGSGRNDGAGSG